MGGLRARLHKKTLAETCISWKSVLNSDSVALVAFSIESVPKLGSIDELWLDNGFEKEIAKCETPWFQTFPLERVPTFLSFIDSILEMILVCRFSVDD